MPKIPRLAQKHYLYLILLLVIGAQILVYYNEHMNSAQPVIRRWRYYITDVACHYFDATDSLPSAEDPSFAPDEGIFFHETSCKGGLNVRQACSVESAARTHPKRLVYVLFSAPVSEFALNTECISRLLEYENVKLVRVHLDKYFKGTPLESVLEKLRQSDFPIKHTADLLKVMTLHKWGGIYLDTNMIVVSPFESLPSNWVAKNSYLYVGAGIMAFSKDDVGRNVTSAIINELSKTFDPHNRNANGAKTIQKVLDEMCETVLHFNCSGVYIFPETLFYPVVQWDVYYAEGSYERTYNNVRSHRKHSWSFTIRLDRNSPFDIIAKEHCPSVYASSESQNKFN